MDTNENESNDFSFPLRLQTSISTTVDNSSPTPLFRRLHSSDHLEPICP